MARRKDLGCVNDPGIVELAEDLKILSDPNRLRIICLLLKGARCVCEVEAELGISQQLTSHHLNVLKERGFLSARKEGTSSYYDVDWGRLSRMQSIMDGYLGRHRGVQAGEESLPCCGQAPGAGRRTGAAVKRTGRVAK